MDVSTIYRLACSDALPKHDFFNSLLEALTLAAGSLPADGQATTIVRAMVPAGSRLEPRQVTFWTTAGKFSPGDVESITVAVGASGEALAVLKAPVTPTLAVVRARAGETTLQDSIRFVTAPSALQSLSISSREVRADGEATVVLRALVPAGAQPGQQVTFSTTSGKFLPNQVDSVIVTVSASGEAAALLRAPTAPALALVRARLGATTLQDSIRFVPAPPALLGLTLSARELPADGASTATIRARLAADATSRMVRFTTSAGTLSDTDAPADSAGYAVVLLRASGELGTALVRAMAGASILLDSVRFVRALPDAVTLEASTYHVAPDAGSTITLTATLARDIGKVTRGTPVEFTATRADGLPLGWFAGVTTSDANGRAAAVYTPGTTDYRGIVTITARAAAADGGTVSARVLVEVRPNS